jgi:putative two-component system response regulator
MTALLGARKIPREIPLGPYLEVAARVAQWSDQRDAFEPGHAERVATLCSLISESLTMEPDETYLLLASAMLHDIGKATLPLELLHQRTPLERHQTQRIRSHPRRGADLLRALDPQEGLAETILYHHERPDGSGYYGREMDEVPRTARALAVAEVYDAMVSSRYRSPMSREDALRALGVLKGRTLDSDCVEALVSKLKRRATVIPLSAPVVLPPKGP